MLNVFGAMNIAAKDKKWKLSYRRRLALYINSWLYSLAFWLDVHTAPKYDPLTWPTLEMNDEEWKKFQEALEEINA
jgi:hypothetical protein